MVLYVLVKFWHPLFFFLRLWKGTRNDALCLDFPSFYCLTWKIRVLTSISLKISILKHVSVFSLTFLFLLLWSPHPFLSNQCYSSFMANSLSKIFPNYSSLSVLLFYPVHSQSKTEICKYYAVLNVFDTHLSANYTINYLRTKIRSYIFENMGTKKAML